MILYIVVVDVSTTPELGVRRESADLCPTR